MSEQTIPHSSSSAVPLDCSSRVLGWQVEATSAGTASIPCTLQMQVVHAISCAKHGAQAGGSASIFLNMEAPASAFSSLGVSESDIKQLVWPTLTPSGELEL